MSRFLAFAILALLMFGAAAMAANAQTTKTRENQGRPTESDPDATTDNDTSSNHSEPRRKPGRLSVDDGEVAGRYVAFTLDLPACAVRPEVR